MVKDGSALPHVSVAAYTNEIDWDNIEWKKYLIDKTEAKGLLYTPNMNLLESTIF